MVATRRNATIAPQEHGKSSSSSSSSAVIETDRLRKENRIDKGRKRSGLELPRKILHSSISILSCYIYTRDPPVSVSSLLKNLVIALAVVGTADLVRFSSKPFARAYNALLGLFMREEEATQVNGVVFYLGGVIFVLAFLPRDIACLSIIVLSLCDTAASIFGRLFSKYTPRLPLSGTLFGSNKSLAGTIAASLVGCLASYIFWSHLAALGDQGDLSVAAARSLQGPAWTGGLQTFDWPRFGALDSSLGMRSLVLLCGAIAGLSEAIDVYGLDDNLSLPILFGVFLWTSLKVLG